MGNLQITRLIKITETEQTGRLLSTVHLCRSPRHHLSHGSIGFMTLLFALLILSACAGLPVRGMVGGQTIDSRVDSEAARYYLEHYLPGNRTDAALDERIDRVYQSANGGLPDRGELKRLSDEFSVDFAALYLADKITYAPVNRRFRIAFDHAYHYTRKALPQDRVKLPATAADYEVLVVPIYHYKRLIGSGADLAAPRAALEKVGLACHFVETQDDGAIEANADLVAAAIRARTQSGRRLIVISASKSSSEVALALTRLGPTETRHVAAWINVRVCFRVPRWRMNIFSRSWNFSWVRWTRPARRV
jgi:hypothetical protein